MIYADYNATTPLSEMARLRMTESFERFGNPSSIHEVGRKAKSLLSEVREKLAELLSRSPDEVVFTSGGSEANQLAILGLALQFGQGFRLMTTAIEHSSIQDLLPLLNKLKAEVHIVPVTESQGFHLEAFKEMVSSIKPHLVSIMATNNETGLIFPLQEIRKLCEEQNILVHSDCVQAFGKLEPHHYAKTPLLSVSAHKIGGPKGVGALVVRRGVVLQATHFGGSQEIKRRGGTENVVGIAGFGGALESLTTLQSWRQVQHLKDVMEEKFISSIPDCAITHRGLLRGPNTINLRIPGVPSQLLLTALDLEKIYVSAGSACSSGSLLPSHVLLGIGLSEQESKEAIRISLGPSLDALSAERLSERIIFHANRLRARHQRLT